jgi:hypothetical protein
MKIIKENGVTTVDFEGLEVDCQGDMKTFFCVSEVFADNIRIVNGEFIFPEKEPE